VFTVRAHSGTNSLSCGPKHSLTIVGVNHFAYLVQVNEAFLRRQPEDAIGFVGPDYAICIKLPDPVADMGDALGFFKPGFVF
jgi:hypothetical protein